MFPPSPPPPPPPRIGSSWAEESDEDEEAEEEEDDLTADRYAIVVAVSTAKDSFSIAELFVMLGLGSC